MLTYSRYVIYFSIAAGLSIVLNLACTESKKNSTLEKSPLKDLKRVINKKRISCLFDYKGMTILGSESGSLLIDFPPSLTIEPKKVEVPAFTDIGEDTTAYIMDFKQSRKLISNLTRIEWMSLAAHEFYHQYFFSKGGNKQKFLKIDRESISFLEEQYKTNKKFKSLILDENRILLKAIREPRDEQAKKYIRRFLEMRSSRTTMYTPTIVAVERFMEGLEGSARYFEALTLAELSNKSLDEINDSERWLWNLNLSEEAYYYTTGYNLSRLMVNQGLDCDNFDSYPVLLNKLDGD